MERFSPKAEGSHPPLGERRAERRAPARLSALLTWASEDEEGAFAAGTVEDLSPGGMGMRVDDSPAERSAVWVLRHDAAPERAEVRHVTPDLDRRRVGLLRVPVERRSEERQPCNGPISLLRRGEPNVEPEPTELRNVSSRGAQLAADRPCSPGQSVRLLEPAGERAGDVRYCEPWRGRYLVGVRFSHDRG